MGGQCGCGCSGLGGVIGAHRFHTVTLSWPHPQKRMQQIMAHCFQAVKSKLQCKLGYFDLIGCDFLIDENFKVLLRHPQVGGRRGGW